MQSKIFLLSLIGFFCTTACVWSPKRSDATYADKLNGENYSSAIAVGGPPNIIVTGPLRVERRISGIIYCGEGLSKIQIRQAQIELKDGPHVVSTGTWKENGQYLIRASFEQNKEYQVHVKSKCGEASKTVPKNLTQDLAEFDFQLSNSN
jgi:hypothetical protein